MKPEMSAHFTTRKPSAIRMAQTYFSQRKDKVSAINTAIGNVSLPMHPSMQKRMFNLKATNSPFRKGVVSYSQTVGYEETNKAFLNIIAASGCNTKYLFSQVTDGGSQAMELVILGTSGPAGTKEKPLMLIDATYTNYAAMAKRLGRATISIQRTLEKDGYFSLPSLKEIDTVMKKHKPGALLIIPYDNPTGQFMTLEIVKKLAHLCVKHNCFIISDEAYRELHYTKNPVSSIWKITEKEVPGITGRRISIESSSKVWNACGLRIGALITDNWNYHQKSVAENSANLCSNVIGQYIFGSIAQESVKDLHSWFNKQRVHYYKTINEVTNKFKHLWPELIISHPDASIYSVVDGRNVVPANFDAEEFVKYCASEGKVVIAKKTYTLLTSPMGEFYTSNKKSNPGKTQMRIAYVETPEKMRLVPQVFIQLLRQYLIKKH